MAYDSRTPASEAQLVGMAAGAGPRWEVLMQENKEDIPVTPKMAVTEDEVKKGLQLIISVGEMLPFKKVWFEVTTVGKDYMVLTPQTTTSRFQKEKARGKKA